MIIVNIWRFMFLRLFSYEIENFHAQRIPSRNRFIRPLKCFGKPRSSPEFQMLDQQFQLPERLAAFNDTHSEYNLGPGIPRVQKSIPHSSDDFHQGHQLKTHSNCCWILGNIRTFAHFTPRANIKFLNI